MRFSLSLLIITAWVVVPPARAQTAVTQSSATQQVPTQPAVNRTGVIQRAPAQQTAVQPTAAQPTGTQPAAATVRGASAAHPSRHSTSRHSRSQRGTGADRRSAAAGQAEGKADGKSDGVLALGATDITGNKELPKVMAIVPWRDSMGAGGVVKPTDSLMDEVLQPVDRAVFQRRIRYYGQLDAAQEPPAATPVAPVGDSH